MIWFVKPVEPPHGGNVLKQVAYETLPSQKPRFDTLTSWPPENVTAPYPETFAAYDCGCVKWQLLVVKLQRPVTSSKLTFAVEVCADNGTKKVSMANAKINTPRYGKDRYGRYPP